MSDSKAISLTANRERPASTSSGYLMLLLLLVAIIVQVWGIVGLARDNDTMAHILGAVVAPFALLFIAGGFYMLQPNQAAAITLFGDYRAFTPSGLMVMV